MLPCVVPRHGSPHRWNGQIQDESPGPVVLAIHRYTRKPHIKMYSGNLYQLLYPRITYVIYLENREERERERESYPIY